MLRLADPGFRLLCGIDLTSYYDILASSIPVEMRPQPNRPFDEQGPLWSAQLKESVMRPTQMPQMILSFHDGWDELIKVHPSVSRIFALLVLPFSLLPPTMIYYAGGNYGDVFAAGVTPGQWHASAGIFFVAELLTVPLMAWLIHLVSRANDVVAGYDKCFTLAAIAPIPLWISSLVLFVPNLALGVAVGTIALLCSLVLTYRGVYALLRMHDDVRALQMATVITGAGLFAWLLLMQIVLMH